MDRSAPVFCDVHGSDMNICRVCRNARNNLSHVFREQYLGLGDEFEYIECSACKSLSIVEIPECMERYYPATYYSYAVKPYNRIIGFLKGRRDRRYLGRFTFIGFLVSFFLAKPPYIEWLLNMGLSYGSSILEVGSGGGTLIVNLQDAGFPTTGIDPYAEPITYSNGAKVIKQSLEETSGSYDCIMLHHCLEHMSAPKETFEHIGRLLKPGGKLLVRIPVAGTYAWKTYGANWFQLDAPRHFVLFSEAALCKLAEKKGFQISKIVYDSTASQIWGSEQYVHGIAHASKKSYAVHPENSMFSKREIEEFNVRAVQLNGNNNGDQAAFYFSKVSLDG